MSAIRQMDMSSVVDFPNMGEENGPLGFRLLRTEDGSPDGDDEGGGWCHLPSQGPEGVLLHTQ